MFPFIAKGKKEAEDKAREEAHERKIPAHAEIDVLGAVVIPLKRRQPRWWRLGGGKQTPGRAIRIQR